MKATTNAKTERKPYTGYAVLFATADEGGTRRLSDDYYSVVNDVVIAPRDTFKTGYRYWLLPAGATLGESLTLAAALEFPEFSLGYFGSFPKLMDAHYQPKRAEAAICCTLGWIA